MSAALSDSDCEELSQLEYYYSPTSHHEEAPGAPLSPEEHRQRESERQAAVAERMESHRREFGAFIKARAAL